MSSKDRLTGTTSQALSMGCDQSPAVATTHAIEESRMADSFISPMVSLPGRGQLGLCLVLETGSYYAASADLEVTI